MKCLVGVLALRTDASLPVRGAWIEIIYIGGGCVLFPVAPRAGSVD